MPRSPRSDRPSAVRWQCLISFPQTLRLIANIRPTGTRGGVAAAQTILRFGSFFVRQVARAYLSRTTKPTHPQAS